MSDTLVDLRLSKKVFVDVSSRVCLPSLKRLHLLYVVYQDDDSLVRLFSSCPNLSYLHVERDHEDNVTKFTVKVPTLETITYFYNGGPLSEDHGGSLVIDSASLKKLCITDYWTKSCSIDNAIIYIGFYPDQEFMRCLSSVMYLELNLSVETVACCEAIQFSQLTECKIRPFQLNWFKPLVLLLQNSPKLKVLVIDQVIFRNEFFPLSCKQPSSVPEYLSTNLEIFEWNEYGGTAKEKEVVRYIFANSKCLKRAGISLRSTCNRKKIMKEL